MAMGTVDELAAIIATHLKGGADVTAILVPWTAVCTGRDKHRGADRTDAVYHFVYQELGPDPMKWLGSRAVEARMRSAPREYAAKLLAHLLAQDLLGSSREV
jgi:hypothetical protein